MRDNTGDDSRSLDGVCVFPECGKPQTDHLRLPICNRHILKTYRLAEMMVRDVLPKSTGLPARPVMNDTSGVVYFLRFAGLIKIGFTTNLRQRLVSIPHEEVLATTPGTMRDEKALHRKFAHLQHKGEWFRADPDLLAHIEALRDAA